jgi:hypothetical protein
MIGLGFLLAASVAAFRTVSPPAPGSVRVMRSGSDWLICLGSHAPQAGLCRLIPAMTFGFAIVIGLVTTSLGVVLHATADWGVPATWGVGLAVMTCAAFVLGIAARSNRFAIRVDEGGNVSLPVDRTQRVLAHTVNAVVCEGRPNRLLSRMSQESGDASSSAETWVLLEINKNGRPERLPVAVWLTDANSANRFRDWLASILQADGNDGRIDSL